MTRLNSIAMALDDRMPDVKSFEYACSCFDELPNERVLLVVWSSVAFSDAARLCASPIAPLTNASSLPILEASALNLASDIAPASNCARKDFSAPSNLRLSAANSLMSKTVSSYLFCRLPKDDETFAIVPSPLAITSISNLAILFSLFKCFLHALALFAQTLALLLAAFDRIIQRPELVNVKVFLLELNVITNIRRICYFSCPCLIMFAPRIEALNFQH